MHKLPLQPARLFRLCFCHSYNRLGWAVHLIYKCVYGMNSDKRGIIVYLVQKDHIRKVVPAIRVVSSFITSGCDKARTNRWRVKKGLLG